MHKYRSILFFLIISFFANAQERYTIKGKVLNINTQLPLESATVYFSTVKDSTILEYTTTNKEGMFTFSTKKYDKPVFLKVSYMGFQTFTEEQKNISENKDFKSIYLSESINTLDGVVVQTETPPIRIKKDTIEFKASSFKVRPDANVETLLKQLPGFEVDNTGKVVVNGKEVTQFLVNGKPFFDRDGAIALKNLPADIINKVQVSDLKTKKEEYAKQEASSDNSSINLTIDENKNKGFFGKFLGGYGSDERYETSFVMNFFDNNRKISFLGSSNNINSPGFSMDEVFDNMGGGRNNRGRNVSSNSGSSKGITVSNLLGLNYSDEWIKDLQTSANYNYSNSTTENLNKSKQTSFLPTGNFTTESQSKTRNENTSNKANAEFEYKVNPSIRIFVAPKFTNSVSNNYSESQSFSRNETDALVNASNSKSIGKSESNNFGNSINLNKSFDKKSRNLSLILNNNNSKTNSNELNNSETIFYQTGQNSDIRNQKRANENSNNSYSAEFEYTEPITDSLLFRIGMDYNSTNVINDVKTYDFDSNTQSYSGINPSLTNYITSKQKSIGPKAGITFEKDKFTLTLNSGTSIVRFDNHSTYMNQLTDLNKNYFLPNLGAQIRYKISKSKFLTAKYDYNVSLPSSSQLLPVTNLANPLNTIVGNPNLNPNEKHSARLNYRNFDFRSRSGYNLFLNGDFYASEIISSSIYDADRKRTTTYENVSGTYSISAGGDWNQSIKREANSLRYGIGVNANLASSKGFTDAILYDAKSIGITPKIYLNYDYGELFTIAPSYNFTFDESRYENYSTKASSTIVHRLNIQTTSYWPKNWVLGNDFGYTYNSKIAPSFKKDFYLWNTSLSYSFYEKKFIAKVKVYDVLNQNQSSTRTISATSILDDANTILKRYAIFSLTYKIQDFSGMKKIPGNRNMNGSRRENWRNR